MRFWLSWAIVTLPLAACIPFWIRSYWLEEVVRYETEDLVVAIGSNFGSAGVTLHTNPVGPQFSLGWSSMRQRAENYSWTPNRVLGFGYQHIKRSPDSILTVE